MIDKLESLLKELNDIKYGYVSLEHQIYTPINPLFDTNLITNYYLERPLETIDNKHGICFDQVELERYYLDKEKITSQSFLLINKSKSDIHSFIITNNEDNYYWIEHAWDKYKGIHMYSSKEELLNDIKHKFILDRTYDINELELYSYDKPIYGITFNELMEYCMNKKTDKN